MVCFSVEFLRKTFLESSLWNRSVYIVFFYYRGILVMLGVLVLLWDFLNYLDFDFFAMFGIALGLMLWYLSPIGLIL
jgi:hypothetical protein